MKIFLITSLILSASIGFAKEIKGTFVPKGNLKTKIMVRGEKAVCKLKLEKTTNILDEEDSFGNPAYKIQATIEINGKEDAKYENKVTFINLFKSGNTSQVEDSKYFVKNAPTISLDVNTNGRVERLSFPSNGQTIVCNF